MESLINTYRLNQGNKEYILTIKTLGQSLRITCKNAFDENINFSRDFPIEQLKKLDEIFYSINTANDALNYIDKALKEQKVGVSEEGETIKINFYVQNEGSNHKLHLTLGEGGLSSTDHTEIIETTTTNTTSSYGMNQNLGVEPNVIYDTSKTITTTDNLDNLLSQLNTDQNQYIDTTNTQYLTSVDNTTDYLQNLQLDSDINQYTTNYDSTPQYTTGLEDLTAQYTTGVTDYGTNYNDTTAQYSTYDTTNQYTYDTYGTTDYNNNDYLNTYTTTHTVETNEYSQPKQDVLDTKPYITPVDDDDTQKNIHNINRYEKIVRTTKTTNVNAGDDRINKLVGDTTSLKNEHQLIQDKLNLLSGVVNEYKTKLELMEKEKAANEVNALRAENRAIKQQLSELNNLRNDAAEVRVLRSQLAQLDPLRKKAAEMDALRGQLNELNALRAKAAELNAVKAQLGELNKLRAQVSQMNVLKQQLNELNALKAKLAELNRIKAQLGELNNLRQQVTQINILKKKINELSNLKDNVVDAEKLKRRITELEAITLKYEQEIKSLRDAQITEQTKLIEFQRMTSEQRMRSGMDSRQLLFEDRAQQICVKGDIIHNTDELELLTRKINKSNQRLTLNLLYKATADSDQASVFHAKCDDARSTLVLIETDKGRRFGGFTTCSWEGDCVDKKDEDAFVFSLDKMMIYENIPGEDAIGCYPKFGPIFLGCQIRIYDNAFTKGGTTYEKGLNFNTEEDYELTGGERAFNVREIEVYEVIPQ